MSHVSEYYAHHEDKEEMKLMLDSVTTNSPDFRNRPISTRWAIHHT